MTVSSTNTLICEQTERATRFRHLRTVSCAKWHQINISDKEMLIHHIRFHKFQIEIQQKSGHAR